MAIDASEDFAQQGSAQPPPGTVGPAEVLWLLSSFCGVYQRSFDANLLARECVPPLGLPDVVRLAELVGLQATAAEFSAADVGRIRVPTAVELTPPTQAETAPPAVSIPRSARSAHQRELWRNSSS